MILTETIIFEPLLHHQDKALPVELVLVTVYGTPYLFTLLLRELSALSPHRPDRLLAVELLVTELQPVLQFSARGFELLLLQQPRQPSVIRLNKEINFAPSNDKT